MPRAHHNDTPSYQRYARYCCQQSENAIGYQMRRRRSWRSWYGRWRSLWLGTNAIQHRSAVRELQIIAREYQHIGSLRLRK
jgi:hypothetical protein